MNRLSIALSVLLLLTACGEEESPDSGPLAIVGAYADDFGQDHAVTAATWIITGFGATSVFNTVGYDNTAQTIIARNATDNDFNPGLWSRFDWTTHDDELWYCQSVVDGATEADARAPAAAADDHSPATTGCGGYAWSRLRVPLTIRGDYVDNWGIAHEITQTTWTQTWATDVSVFNISLFDNDAGLVIAQNDAANASLPNRWSRIDWITHAGDLWYCQSTSDADNEAAAQASPAPDASDPSNGGCGGVSWSRLDEAP